MTRDGQKGTSGPKTVLVIDDDESLRRVVEYNLREEGHRVLIAVDGTTGWQTFQDEAVALVVTDVRMPEMDGPKHNSVPHAEVWSRA